MGRICRIGRDFIRARDEDASPVRFWHGEGPLTQRSTARPSGTWRELCDCNTRGDIRDVTFLDRAFPELTLIGVRSAYLPARHR
jgi:hypothetical protein